MAYFIAAFASFVLTLIAALSTRFDLRVCTLLGFAVPFAGLVALLDKTASGLWLLAALIILGFTGANAAVGAYAGGRMRR